MKSALDQLKHTYAYVLWADDEILSAAATVSDEGFVREQGISVGSIHKLLIHAVSVQQVWLSRWEGDSAQKPLVPGEFPTLADVKTIWADVHRRLSAFLESLTEDALDRRITYRRNDVSYTHPLRHLLAHVADHATYHRGQLNSMIKLAGGTPCEASYLAYVRLQAGEPT